MGTEKPWVEYNWLSENCGLKVSNICLGAGNFGAPMKLFDVPGYANKENAIGILNRYAELGGNFVDTSNIYCAGESEKIIGSWLSSRDRSSIVLATKVFWPLDLGSDSKMENLGNDSKPNLKGLSRGSIMYNIEQSLRRLQTDYIDLYYMHYTDKGVKIEETLRTFDDLVRAGKIRYIGLSNYTGTMLQKMVDYSHFMGFTPCVALQQEYSLASRESDIEVVPACRREGVSLIPYSPLRGGLLTGKFKRDDQSAATTLADTRLGWVAERMAEKPDEGFLTTIPYIESVRKDDNFWKLMDAIEDIGKQHGKTPGQVSLRWLLQKDFIPSIVIGVRNILQLEQNMEAGTGWRLTDEQMKQLDELSSYSCPIPKYPYQTIDFWNNTMGRIRKT